MRLLNICKLSVKTSCCLLSSLLKNLLMKSPCSQLKGLIAFVVLIARHVVAAAEPVTFLRVVDSGVAALRCAFVLAAHCAASFQLPRGFAVHAACFRVGAVLLLGVAVIAHCAASSRWSGQFQQTSERFHVGAWPRCVFLLLKLNGFHVLRVLCFQAASSLRGCG